MAFCRKPHSYALGNGNGETEDVKTTSKANMSKSQQVPRGGEPERGESVFLRDVLP